MIEHWSSGAADDCMPEEMLVGTLRKVRKHPWWLARATLAKALLARNRVMPPAHVVDVGCGWGVTLESLEEAGFNAVGLDISAQILRMIDKPNRHLVEADLAQPFPSSAPLADAILALDVIEHLDDDRGALSRMACLLKPGGLALISVPAMPELFSEFDSMQGHRRRYLPETLRAAFSGSGLQVSSVIWWGAWMVPILRRMRRKQCGAGATKARTYADYLRLPIWPGPLLMRMAYAWEHRLTLAGLRQTGTSLFAIASKEK